MKRFLKSFRYGEKGFTLIELLIVVAILGILAAVILPNVSGFLSTANMAAANTEAASVKTAAAASYAKNGEWPTDSGGLKTAELLDREPEETYTFDTTNGLILSATETGKWGSAGFTFSSTNQSWQE